LIIDGFKKTCFTESKLPLGGGATFTGLAHDTTATQVIMPLVAPAPPTNQPFQQGVQSGTFILATAFADQAGTLFVEQSDDGTTNWTYTPTDTVAVPLGLPAQRLKVPLDKRYWRVRFLNGGVAQTTFVLTSCQTGGD
jgi:hypothetical protein